MTLPKWTALAVFSLAVTLLLLPAPEGWEPRVLRGAGLVIFAMGFFATGVLPEFVTGLAFFAVASLIAVAPAEVIFAGWSSTALWLTFGGLIVGIAVNRTGLGARLAARLTGLFGETYKAQVAAMVLVGVALAFLMPSTLGRVILLVPIALALADRLGLTAGRNGRHGLVMAVACATWMPAVAILPANVPNMVLAGTAETLYGMHFTYGAYLLLHFPVTGLLKAVAIYFVVLWLFPDRAEPASAIAEASPMTRDEKVLAWVLAVTLALWALDFWHGVSPAWIALSAGVICLLPGVDLVRQEDFMTRFNTASVIYIAAVLSVAAIIVDSGVGRELAARILPLLPLDPASPATNFATLVGLGSMTGVLATAPSVPAVLPPFAQDLATATGLPLVSVLMTFALGYSTVFLPYQVPPLVVALQLGGVGLRRAGVFTLLLAVVTIALLLPLSYIWWRFLGYLP
ncbi:MAG: sodium:sulfate symporter [Rhodospirillales bacterium CG15_BIG_FIL_POST_REV_8_21_14_020_66_15]|nr:MAG: sodium:sulfate symporter [Rhodospirillales bacterium CG15_BIG_FIL_POST_REV_8_21_14_020_66_15]